MGIVFLMLKNTWLKKGHKRQPVFKYFQTFTGTNENFTWRSKELLEESYKICVKSDNSFAPKAIYIYN